jgi:hypothetical protein
VYAYQPKKELLQNTKAFVEDLNLFVLQAKLNNRCQFSVEWLRVVVRETNEFLEQREVVEQGWLVGDLQFVRRLLQVTKMLSWGTARLEEFLGDNWEKRFDGAFGITLAEC